jgi:hypothetical protein
VLRTQQVVNTARSLEPTTHAQATGMTAERLPCAETQCSDMPEPHLQHAGRHGRCSWRPDARLLCLLGRPLRLPGQALVAALELLVLGQQLGQCSVCCLLELALRLVGDKGAGRRCRVHTTMGRRLSARLQDEGLAGP